MPDASRPPSAVNVAASPESLRKLATFWGTAFWLPLFLPLLAELSTTPSERIDLPKFLQIALAPLPITLLSAWWWATRGRRIGSGAFVLAAFWQGTFVTVLIAILLAATVSSAFRTKDWLPAARDVEPLLQVDVCVSLYLLLLGAVVVWRARRRLGEAHVEPESTNPGTRFARAGLALLGPTLLCAPLFAILVFDTAARREASAKLGAEIDRIRMQIPDLLDLEQVRARVLARKQILQALETESPRTAAALAVAGELPTGVRLLSLEADGERLALGVAEPSDDAELALIERLGAHGWRNIRVLAAEAGEGASAVRIEAHWPQQAAP